MIKDPFQTKHHLLQGVQYFLQLFSQHELPYIYICVLNTSVSVHQRTTTRISYHNSSISNLSLYSISVRTMKIKSCVCEFMWWCALYYIHHNYEFTLHILQQDWSLALWKTKRERERQRRCEWESNLQGYSFMTIIAAIAHLKRSI